jgi:S1-C subfamily serine protease
MGKASRRPIIDASPGRDQRRTVFDRIRRSVVGIARGRAGISPGQRDSMRDGEPVSYAPIGDVVEIVGSGFFADEAGVVLTAYHVVRDWLDDRSEAERAGHLHSLDPFELHVVGLIKFRGDSDGAIHNQFFRAPILGATVNPELDLAALLLPSPPRDPQQGVLPARLAEDLPENGDEIGVAGFPLGSHLLRMYKQAALLPSFSSGIVSSALPFPNAPAKLRQSMRLNVIVHQGNSGGPVFDIQSGDVIGIVSNGVETKANRLPLGFAGATYAHHARPLIQSVLTDREMKPGSDSSSGYQAP